MRYTNCCVAVASMHKFPDHASEMVSQLLFGECAIITDNEKDGWCKIIVKEDSYSGWCQQSHLEDIGEGEYLTEQRELAGEWVNKVSVNGKSMMVPFGSSLSAISNGKKMEGGNMIHYAGSIWNTKEARPDCQTIKKIAFTYLNTSYLWGGRSVFGIDCSGFTQQLYRFLNISLPRDAHMQAGEGQIVELLEDAQCGDLAFFDNEEGKIIHVGLLLDVGQIIHAGGKVRIDNIDKKGLVNAETGKRSQRLRLIKRYFK